MAKYIDADLLLKEVKKLERAAHKSALGCADSETRKFHDGKDFAYQNVGILIDSLQQEQPEVDLNAEIEKELRLHYNDDQDVYWWNYLKNSFRHFYELGKNARKEK